MPPDIFCASEEPNPCACVGASLGRLKQNKCILLTHFHSPHYLRRSVGVLSIRWTSFCYGLGEVLLACSRVSGLCRLESESEE